MPSDAGRADGDPATERPHCSRKDCRAPAEWALLWNNPKVHTPERRKTWLACDEHREYLGHFLDRRGFLLATVPFTEYEESGHDPR